MSNYEIGKKQVKKNNVNPYSLIKLVLQAI